MKVIIMKKTNFKKPVFNKNNENSFKKQCLENKYFEFALNKKDAFSCGSKLWKNAKRKKPCLDLNNDFFSNEKLIENEIIYSSKIEGIKLFDDIKK